jgi:hypothetical protein
MLRSVRPEGTYHSAKDGSAMYLQPTPTRFKTAVVRDDAGVPVLDEHGVILERAIWIREPWRRVTPKRSTKRRRLALRIEGLST